MPVITFAADLRAAARRGEWRGTTTGHCPAYQQVNLAILPKDVAVEFAAFCTRNPKPCPIIEITPPGDPEPARSAPGADLRTDVPGYRIYRKGELAEQRSDIRDVWRDDLVRVSAWLQLHLRARVGRSGDFTTKRRARHQSLHVRVEYHRGARRSRS